MADLKENNVCVYLVDDDEFYLKVFENKFRSSTNCIVKSFTSGESLVDELRRRPLPKKNLHIVVMDYYLKSMQNQDAKNGIEILKMIKEISPEIDIILYSGMEDDSIVNKAIQLGAITFVKKNENSFLRIHNSIKWIVSKKKLERKQRSSKFTKKAFIALLIAAVVGFILVYLFYPEMF